MTQKTMALWKNLLLIASFLAMVTLLVFSFSAEIGTFIWKYARLPEPALFLRPEAKFALEIGNYYFNVYQDGAYDLQKAEKYFNRALFFDPNVPDAWHQLARIDFLQGEFILALQKINRQIAIHGESFMASYYVRGLILGYAGNFNQAEEDFKKFLKWDTEDWAAYNDLAWIYFQKGAYEKAEESALEGLQHNPTNPWLLNSLGVSILNQGQKDEAYEAFLRAKQYADILTEDDWHRAYPGNDPGNALQGLDSIKDTIQFNLSLTAGSI